MGEPQAGRGRLQFKGEVLGAGRQAKFYCRRRLNKLALPAPVSVPEVSPTPRRLFAVEKY